MKNKLLNLVLIIFIMFISTNCFAESEIKVSAFVDKDKISLDDFLNFTIKIEGIDNSYKNPKIKLPSLENNFTIVASSQSNNISLKGSKIDMAWQMQYTLSPKNEGTVKIDSAEVIYKGKTFKTEPITITVGPFSTPKSRRDIPQQAPPKKVPWQEKEGILI